MIYSEQSIEPRYISFGETEVPVYTFNTMIVGSGAAGLMAAERLISLGVTSVAVVTEGMRSGASRGAGASPQSVYCGSDKRRAERFASVDPNLAETVISGAARAFHHLADLGVNFPEDRFGRFEEDNGAASAGFFTVRDIASALDESDAMRQVPVFNRFRVVSVITDSEDESAKSNAAVGILSIDCDSQRQFAEDSEVYNQSQRIKNANASIFGKIKERISGHKKPYYPEDEDIPPPRGNKYGYTLFSAVNIIWAAGGIGGVFDPDCSFYPDTAGSIGAALLAGAVGQNLSEICYSIGVIESDGKDGFFKWKLEGDLLSCLPRFYSRADDSGEADFMSGHIAPDALGDILLARSKQSCADYQSATGVFDYAVMREISIGRAVFADYSGEPVKRLIAANLPLYKLFLENGIDLKKDHLPLTIAAWHMSGGLKTDINFETTVRHLFAVGESASCLPPVPARGMPVSAAAVGALRAARRIAGEYNSENLGAMDFYVAAKDAVTNAVKTADKILKGAVKRAASGNVSATADRYRSRLRSCFDSLRTLADIVIVCLEYEDDAEDFHSDHKIDDPVYLAEVFRNRDILAVCRAIVQSEREYILAGGGVRGSRIIAGSAKEFFNGCAGLGEAAAMRIKNPRRRAKDEEYITSRDLSGYSIDVNVSDKEVICELCELPQLPPLL